MSANPQLCCCWNLSIQKTSAKQPKNQNILTAFVALVLQSKTKTFIYYNCIFNIQI